MINLFFFVCETEALRINIFFTNLRGNLICLFVGRILSMTKNIIINIELKIQMKKETYSYDV